MYKTPETADGGLLSDIPLENVIPGKRKRADEEGAADEKKDEPKEAPSGNVVSNLRRYTQAERETRGIQQLQSSTGQLSFLELCKELNISPFTCDGLLPEEGEVLHCITQDGFSEQYESDAEAKKLLVFLYGHEFKRNGPQSARIEAIAKILTPSSDPNVRGPYERLQRTVQVDSDNDLHDLGGNVKSYCSEWQEMVRIWGSSVWGSSAHAMTIFNCAPITIVHRRQLS
jgi:hypothetical protein